MGNVIANPKKFEKKELASVKLLFKGLASRSKSQNMDKRTFLQFFEYPGLVGERIFNLFDHDHDGWINEREFVDNLGAYVNATTDEKIQVLFKLYDLTDDHLVSIREMRMMLYSLTQLPFLIPNTKKTNQPEKTSNDVVKMKTISEADTRDAQDRVLDVVEKAFEEHNVDKTGQLTYDDFSHWIQSCPGMIAFLDFTFCKEKIWLKSATSGNDRKNATMEGDLLSHGKYNKHAIKTHYYILSQRFLFKFEEKDSEAPKDTIFVHGLRVEEGAEVKGHWPIKIIAPEHSWTLFATSREDQKKWLSALQVHSRSASIAKYYSIGDQLGVGRFATVHLATHLKTQKQFAMKITDKSNTNEEDMEGVRFELAIMSMVDHHSLMKRIEVFESERYLYIIMELVKGGDLVKKLMRDKFIEEWVSRKIARNVLSAIKYLHTRGIVHRDIKPENILVRRPDELDCSDIMLTDFGCSTFVLPGETMEMPVGTKFYLAPEILSGDPYTKAVDIWSLGVITYAMLSGALPFVAESFKQMRKLTAQRGNDKLKWHGTRWDSISAEAKEFIKACLNPDPDERITAVDACNHDWFKLTLKRTNSRNSPPSSPNIAPKNPASPPGSPHKLPLPTRVTPSSPMSPIPPTEEA